MDESNKTSKERRIERKKMKLVAEFNITKSNDDDNENRPSRGFLDGQDIKRIKLESDSPQKPEEATKLSDEDFRKLKKELQERKKYLSQLPRFYTQLTGLQASLSEPYDKRFPILMTDVQHLIFYALCGNNVVQPPYRWCVLQKQNRLTNVVVFVIEGVSCDDFTLNEHLFPKLTNHFPDRVEVVSSYTYGCDISQDLVCIPLTSSQKQKLLEEHGNLEAAASSLEIFKIFRSIFPIYHDTEEKVNVEFTLPKSDIFPRTFLILNIYQMIGENFPLPYKDQVIRGKVKSFKTSKKEYKEISVNSPIFAIDCEMCSTEVDPQELTRICVVNEDLEVVYETLVKPKNKIINYLTQYSGITKKMLKNVTVTLEDVQKKLDEILPPDAILVGHSLNGDLEAIQITHPYVIDTSIIYNLSGRRELKAKLSVLSDQFLDEKIQLGDKGHNPIEDSTAAMKLVKLKLAKGFAFGDALAVAQEPKIPQSQLNFSLINHSRKSSKSVAIIAPESTLETYKKFSSGKFEANFTATSATKPQEVVSKLQDAAVSHNFTIAHINLASKLERKKEKYLKKIDKWCGKVYDHTSLNGMCIVLFSGLKSKSAAAAESDNINHTMTISTDTDTSSIDNNSSTTTTTLEDNGNSTIENGQKENGEEKIQLESSDTISLPKIPRHNGVCFIRIKTLKK